MKKSKEEIQIDAMNSMIHKRDNTIDKLKRSRLNIIMGSICLLLFTLFITFFIVSAKGNTIDENKFCLDKLNKYYPEYKFTEADYLEDFSTNSNTIKPYSCKGIYFEEDNLSKRDGLEEIGERTELFKYFRLTEEKDISYLKEDDWTEWTLILFFVFLLSFVCILCSWGSGELSS